MERVLKIANDYIQTPKGFVDLLFYRQILENKLITDENISEMKGKTVLGLPYSLGQIPLWFFYMDPKNLTDDSQTISVGSICYPRDINLFLKQFCFCRFGQKKFPLFIRHRFYDRWQKEDRSIFNKIKGFVQLMLTKAKHVLLYRVKIM